MSGPLEAHPTAGTCGADAGIARSRFAELERAGAVA